MESKILKEFGLTQNEIDIFLVLVQKGTLNPTEIAKETGFNRPYVYYALERLLEKGYIGEISVHGKKNFKALDLKQISALEEHKLDILHKLLSGLEKIRKRGIEETDVEVLKGKYVIKNIFKKILAEIKPKEEILYIGLDEEKMEVVEPIYLKKVLNYFKKKKITERIIIKKGGKRLKYAYTTRYRSLTSNLIGNTAKIIYQDTIVELIYGTPIYAITMKNKQLVETARKQFEIFWKIAK